MTDIRVVSDYSYPPTKVWHALTDPALMVLWGMRPEGFATVVGTQFKLVARPERGWRGFVECEVLEAEAPARLRFAWRGDKGDKPTFVTFIVELFSGGTRLSLSHTGYTGMGGFMFVKLIMSPAWKHILAKTLPAVLADLDDAGKLRPQSTLRPLF